MLQARNVTVEVGGRPTLIGGSFALRAGDKVGLVGRNGAGKTSLLRVLAGDEPAAAGMVLRGERVGFLPQEAQPQGIAEGATALDHVLSGQGLDEVMRRVERLHRAVEEAPTDRNIARFTHAEEEFRAAGGYAAESEVRRICAGLGLPADRVDLPVRALSGGERRRIELARILFAGNDLLLLDEPTNHLDNDAKQWLLGFLRAYRGSLLVVSHDLELLDEAITRVLHLDDATLVEYRGTYSQYREARARDEARLAKVAAHQGTEIDRLRRLADSMRGQTAKRARQAKSLDTRVARLEGQRVTAKRRERAVVVRFPEPPRAGAIVVDVDGLTKGYGGPPVFEDITFDVGRGERLLVLGLNGAGKTSLMRVLAGQADADRGTVRLGHNVSAGYYAQEHEGITAGRDVISHLRASAPLSDQVLRSLLGTFGLSGDIAFQDAATLSGGEKTKLALAQLVAGRHNVLLLDEPTNNLDPPSRDAVGDALAQWPGAIVLVSHDTEFVARLEPTRALVMPDGELDFFSDDMLELVALA